MEDTMVTFVFILIIIFLVVVFWWQQCDGKNYTYNKCDNKCNNKYSKRDYSSHSYSYDDDDTYHKERVRKVEKVTVPPTIFMSRDEYLCTERDNGENAICSGNGVDNKGGNWRIIDVAEYQVRNRDDVRRFINMRLTNGCDTYILEGLGYGEQSPTPEAESGFNFAVTNLNNINATMKPVNDGSIDGWIINFSHA